MIHYGDLIDVIAWISVTCYLLLLLSACRYHYYYSKERGGEKERERKESGLDGSNEEKKVKNLKESRVRRREDRESGEVQSQTLLN